MKRISHEKYTSGDESAIVALYNHITSRSKTVTQHLWQWKKAIEYKSIWVLKDNESKEIIAHHGLMPYELQVNGKTLLLGKTENSVIHPKYSGTGIYILFEKKIKEEALELFDALITTSGSGKVKKIRERLGYKAISPYAYYIKPSSLWGFIRSCNHISNKFIKNRFLKTLLYIPKIACFSLLWIILNLHIPHGNKKLAIDHYHQTDSIKQELENFLKNMAPKLGVTLSRTIEFLDWRFFENPNTKHTLFVAREKNTIVGYMILSKVNTISYLLVGDVVIQDHNSEIFRSLVEASLKFYGKNNVGFMAFPTLAGKNRVSTLLKKTSFVDISRLNQYFPSFFKGFMAPSDSEFLVHINKDSPVSHLLYDSQEWYFTSIFLEGRI